MSTTARVLPWRRQAGVADDLQPVLAAYRQRHPKGGTEAIRAAFHAAEEAHRLQSRMSGESYISHPIAVARVVAELGLDEVSIVAALLHDAVEDTELTLDDVEGRFGPEVASIVDGLTKIERLESDDREARQAATIRKMLVAMSRDIRVLIIKLADRLHNMRTIASAAPAKRERIGRETLEIYAPLAHRLGMQDIRQQLEDLSFAAMYPKRYAELDHQVATRAPERDVYLAKALGQINGWLADAGIRAEMTARGKHLWSLYQKMMDKGRGFDEIYDLMAIRIVVDSVRDCYAALGCIHANWKPVVGRFKDYIAMPKFNLYQSLHTTVIGPQGKPIEVQIRSRDMHRRAEWGVASHWSYKEGGADADWLDRIIDWQDEVSDPRQFLESLKTDLERDEVFAFTPKGRVIALPVGSTPVDFAYSVHTEIGHRCVGARVNGRLVPLETRLSSGDTCEILTTSDDGDGPREEWLEFVVSPKATSKIRQWMARERNEDLLDAGRDELVAEVARLGANPDDVLSSPALDDEAASMNYADRTSLYRAIGEGHVAAPQVASRLVRLVEAEDASVPQRAVAPVAAAGIRVEGMDAAAVRVAECCAPLLGDDLLALHTGGTDVVVHRADCPDGIGSVVEGRGKVVDADWAGGLAGSSVTAVVEVVAIDRSRLLRDVANALSEEHVNIVACSTHTGNDRVARMRFEFELADPSHLKSVLRTIRRIDSVYDAYRIGSIGSVAP